MVLAPHGANCLNIYCGTCQLFKYNSHLIAYEILKYSNIPTDDEAEEIVDVIACKMKSLRNNKYTYGIIKICTIKYIL